MRVGVLCLELGMPTIHLSVIEACTTQHRHPCVLDDEKKVVPAAWQSLSGGV
jgi:hypothetical protein